MYFTLLFFAKQIEGVLVVIPRISVMLRNLMY